MTYPNLTTRDPNGNYPEWYFDSRSLPLRLARFLGWMEDGCSELDPVTMAGYGAIFIGVAALVKMFLTDVNACLTGVGVFLAMLGIKGATNKWQNMKAGQETTTTTATITAAPAVTTTTATITAAPAVTTTATTETTSPTPKKRGSR